MIAEQEMRTGSWGKVFWSHSLAAKLAIPVTMQIHFVNKVKVFAGLVLGPVVIVKMFGSVFDSYCLSCWRELKQCSKGYGYKWWPLARINFPALWITALEAHLEVAFSSST